MSIDIQHFQYSLQNWLFALIAEEKTDQLIRIFGLSIHKTFLDCLFYVRFSKVLYA